MLSLVLGSTRSNYVESRQHIALMSKLKCPQSDIDSWVNSQAEFVMKVKFCLICSLVLLEAGMPTSLIKR